MAADTQITRLLDSTLRYAVTRRGGGLEAWLVVQVGGDVDQDGGASIRDGLQRS
jgi:hypothetical protein